jgi:hypothetical protein
MHRFGIPGRSRLVVAIAAVTCLAAACGGGKDGPAGPGGDGNGGGNGAVAGDYLLVGAGGNAVPAIINSPICGQSQIFNGSLTLGADGNYEMRFNWQDDEGQDYAADHGRYQVQGTRLEFTSEAWDDQFEGQVAGGLVQLTWDFCNDNQGPELELTFAN